MSFKSHHEDCLNVFVRIISRNEIYAAFTCTFVSLFLLWCVGLRTGNHNCGLEFLCIGLPKWEKIILCFLSCIINITPIKISQQCQTICYMIQLSVKYLDKYLGLMLNNWGKKCICFALIGGDNESSLKTGRLKCECSFSFQYL